MSRGIGKVSYSNLSHLFFLFLSIGVAGTGILTIGDISEPPQIFIWLVGVATFFFALSDVSKKNKYKWLSPTFLVIAMLMLCIAIIVPINGFRAMPNFPPNIVEGLALLALGILLISFAWKAMNEGKEAMEGKDLPTEEKDPE